MIADPAVAGSAVINFPEILIDSLDFFVLIFTPIIAQKNLPFSRIGHWSLFSDALPRQAGGLLKQNESEIQTVMGNRLYVGNLPFTTTEIELQDMFAQAGAVTEVLLMQDKFTGKSRGFAFVTMATEAEALNAVKELDGKQIDGRPLRVNEARPRDERGFGGGGGGGGGGGYEDRRGGGGGGGGGGHRGEGRGGGGGYRGSGDRRGGGGDRRDTRRY